MMRLGRGGFEGEGTVCVTAATGPLVQALLAALDLHVVALIEVQLLLIRQPE